MKVFPHDSLQEVYWIEKPDGKKMLATKNLAPGIRVYGEELIKIEGIEYRIWDPYRSKLAAAILKEMDVSMIKPGAKILYLGASTGTTASHVSDIVGARGKVFAIEVSARVMREFTERVASHRSNVYPILADARHAENYSDVVGTVDVVYCDVAQPDETEIAMENCYQMLKKSGLLCLAIKARSIDATKEPEEIFERERKKLAEGGFKILDIKHLYPFDKDHAMVISILRK
ncbi:MAG: fibrillarin-like rRNA/tRNA 2'-O-methyltransferase [Candidatus Nealsonbacteria bacterium]|nr:MAG: fibrillarin-like rRNA/tRNA 2'-O-methyltransferase [Candidatus Nealsonbacteria bacterium]